MHYWVKATNAFGASGFSIGTSGYAADTPPAAPAAPTGVTASTNFTNRVSVSWTAISGLTDYLVWRNTANNSSGASYLSNAIGTSYDDTTASPDTTYYYWVQTWSTWGVSDFSSSAMGLRLSTTSTLSAPSSVLATDGTYTNRVRVSWPAVSGATSYEVWGGLTNDTGVASLRGETTDTSYDDMAVTPGICVYYRVKSKNALGVSVFSSPDVGFASLGGSTLADLSLTNFMFLPRALAPGANPSKVTFQLSNNGPANMASSNTRYLVEFYFSTNATFGDLDDVWIGEYASDVTLSSGLSTNLTLSETARSEIIIPPGPFRLDAQVYYMFARVDHTSPSTLSDTNGDNNAAMRPGTVLKDVSSVSRLTRNDYDGDGQSDLAVCHYVDSGEGFYSWYIWSLSPGTMIGRGYYEIFGVGGDTPVLGGNHYGDGYSDLGIIDTNGVFYIRPLGPEQVPSAAVGWPGAIIVPGDYDRDYDEDGGSDFAFFDSNVGTWYIRRLSGSILAWALEWGWSGAIPVSGDYDGDGQSDLAVYDSNFGRWYIRTMSGTILAWDVVWGGFPGAIPVPGDYDGDGSADLAIFDGDTGEWYILTVSGTVLAWRLPWGWSSSVVVPGDYDGDGISDLAVFDIATGNWYIRTLGGTILAWEIEWGSPGDIVVGGLE